MGAPANAGVHVGIPVDVLEDDFDEVGDIADVALAWGEDEENSEVELVCKELDEDVDFLDELCEGLDAEVIFEYIECAIEKLAEEVVLTYVAWEMLDEDLMITGVDLEPEELKNEAMLVGIVCEGVDENVTYLGVDLEVVRVGETLCRMGA